MDINNILNQPKVCCICGNVYTGYGNNAEPVMEGRCCNDCNISKVLPVRMMIYNLRPDNYNGKH